MSHVTKQIHPAAILENDAIGSGVFRMVLDPGTEPAVFQSAAPGQFVNLYLNDNSLLLPRPLSICAVRNGNPVLVYAAAGKGTAQLAGSRPGQTLRISTPLGRGFDVAAAANAKSVVLVGGGIGAAPLPGLARTIRERFGCHIQAALGFRSRPFLLKEFYEVCDVVYIATDDGSLGYHGTVIDLMEEKQIDGSLFFACGPSPMLRTLCGWCRKPLQISLEERMGCGYGACVSCTCLVKGPDAVSAVSAEEDGRQGETNRGIQRKKVCTDGPVFNGNEVIWHAE